VRLKRPWRNRDRAAQAPVTRPNRETHEEITESVTQRIPARASLKSGRAPIPPGERRIAREEHEFATHRLERQSDAPPSIGRIAGTWQRHLTVSVWRRPSLAADYGVMGTWRVAAASALGRTHAHRAQERQDAYGLTLNGEMLVAAIADGVSGAEFGGPAADIGVEVALSAIETGALSSALVLESLDAASGEAGKAIGRFAQRLGVCPDKCATTLLLVAAETPREDRDDLELSVVSVGDSSVLELRKDASVGVLVGPERAESSSALDDYLPRGDRKVIRRRVRVPRNSAVLLATDGFAQDLRQSATVREWVVTQLGRTATPIDAAHVLSYQRQRSNDDLTFVALWPL
jgi:serine/threonine protein phosphatase PrpC